MFIRASQCSSVAAFLSFWMTALPRMTRTKRASSYASWREQRTAYFVAVGIDSTARIFWIMTIESANSSASS